MTLWKMSTEQPFKYFFLNWNTNHNIYFSSSDLYGADIKQASILDMMNSAVEDIRGAYVRMIYQNYVSKPYQLKEMCVHVHFDTTKMGKHMKNITLVK